ncbi:MAG TPA: hypothetical protein VE196_03695 [Pseudonocardiaceae bacterium]|nr:hypothetical protein [Pseudonocardiaceae bacterium]
MTPHLTSGLTTRTAPSGGVLTGHSNAVASPRGSDLGVRPGESDPARVLGAVLVLTGVTIIVGWVWVLVWWLA